MWKCVPRNLRESVERRVTRKISRSERPPGQDAKQVAALQTKLISPATQPLNGFSTPDNNGKRLTEFGKSNWEPQTIAKIGKTFRHQSSETCKILTAIIPSLTRQFNSSNSKGFNHCAENKNTCGSKKKKKEKQDENAWENGAHLEHTLFSALGWSSVLVLGWYMIQPLCRFWVLPYDKEKKRSKYHKFRLNAGSRDRRQDLRYVSLVDALSRTALAQPLSVLSRQQAENVTLHDELDSFLAADQVTNTVSKTDGLEENHVSGVTFGPQTAEEALDEAAESFFKVHNAAVGDIENSMGVSLMQEGRHKEAVSFFIRGMQYDNTVATFNLAVCYEKGLGIGQDLKKAARYYRAASDKGHATAMYNLGVFHVHGLGDLPVDLDQAYALFEKASTLGQSDAKRALDMVPANSPVKKVDNVASDESTKALLQALGLVENAQVNEDYIRGEIQEEDNSSDVIMLSNGSQLDIKDLTQLMEDTIFKYKVCH